MSRAAWSLLWTVVVWVALWGEATVANLVGGLAAGAFALWIVPAGRTAHRPNAMTLRPLAAMHFLLYFLWALVRASAIVAWEVVTPRNRISQGIIALPLRTSSHGVATLVANAISLTPGTLTLEVARDPLVLYVHVLHLVDMESVRAELRRLEELACRAFDTTTFDREGAS